MIWYCPAGNFPLQTTTAPYEPAGTWLEETPLPLVTPAVYPAPVFPCDLPLVTGAIHCPSGPSSPTEIEASAGVATQTWIVPLVEPTDVTGTRVVLPSCTNTLLCTSGWPGEKTTEPLLPAATVITCPGFAGPTNDARTCSHAIVPSCGPKSVPSDRLTATGRCIASARSKRNVTPVTMSSVSNEPLLSLPMRANRIWPFGAMPAYVPVAPPLPAAMDVTCVPWPTSSFGNDFGVPIRASMSLPCRTAPPYFASSSG